MELFITEHYWGYNTQRNNDSMEYQVEHATWRTRSVDLDRYDLNLNEIYGSQWEEALAGEPDTIVFAEGSEITVYSGNRICL
jgi:hypothetical protein